MSRNTWMQLLAAAATAGPNLTASTAATSLLNAQDKAIIPAGDMIPGRQFKIEVMGQISNIGTTPGTLTLDVRLGAVIAFNGGAMQLNAVAKTTVPFLLEIWLTCRAIGNSTNANLMGLAQFTSEAVVGSPVPGTGGSGALLLPAGTPAVGTGFDSTASQAVDLFGTFSLNNANAIQVLQYSLLSRN